MADVPPLKIYGDRVYDMLREYQGLSKGKMTLEVLDPRPDTEIEESAQKYGLQGVPVQQGGDRLFLGLVLKSERGTEERIPFFNPQKEDTLEYDITKAIYNINNPQRKKIAIASGLPVMGSAPQNMMMQQQQQPQKPWLSCAS